MTDLTLMIVFVVVGIGVDDVFVISDYLDQLDPAQPIFERLPEVRAPAPPRSPRAPLRAGAALPPCESL